MAYDETIPEKDNFILDDISQMRDNYTELKSSNGAGIVGYNNANTQIKSSTSQGAINDLNNNLATRLSDILTEGVLTGGDVTENSTPDLNVLIEPLTGFNTNGARINLENQQIVDLSSFLPITTGNEKYVSIYIDVIDLETNTEINVVEGTSAVAGSATKPPVDNTQGVLLADVLLAEGQTSILNVNIKEVRKQKIYLNNIAGQMDYVNVKDFGAKGDGVTDDTEKLQEIINNNKNNSVIYFPEGIYKFSKINLDNLNNVKFITEQKSILKTTLSNTDFDDNTKYPIFINNSNNIQFINITFEGNSSYELFIKILETNNIFINNCSFINTKGFSLYLELVEHFFLFNTKMNNATIWCSECLYGKIQNNYFINTDIDAIKITEFSDYIIINNNYIINDGVNKTNADGIDLFTRGQYIIITNNIFKGLPTAGIVIKTVMRDSGTSSDNNGYSRKINISNNHFLNISGYAIDIHMDDERSSPTYNSENYPSFVNISNNLFENNNTSDIFIKFGKYINVNNNRFINTNNYAITISEGAEKINIINNFIENVVTAFLLTSGGNAKFKNSIIKNNIIDTTSDHGLTVRGENILIINNIILNTVNRGINLLYGNRSSIINNNIQNCGIGLNLKNIDYCNISNNKIEDCETGIYLTGTFGYNTVIGNLSVNNTTNFNTNLTQENLDNLNKNNNTNCFNNI